VSNNYSLKDLLPLVELDEYIAIDLETTGLNPQTDYITEIAACRFMNGEFKDEFTSLINPGISIPKNIVEITGITDDMLSDAPSIEDMIPQLMKFIGHSPLVGHNIDFDYSFISKCCASNDVLFPEVSMYDTLSLARTFIYYNNSFSLTSLCDFYNISIDQAHRARADAMATGILFRYLLQEAISRPLTLIQQMDTILKNYDQIYNHQLFSNILKTAVSKNSLDGLMDSVYEYITPNNIFGSDTLPKDSQLPDTPAQWFEDDRQRSGSEEQHPHSCLSDRINGNQWNLKARF